MPQKPKIGRVDIATLQPSYLRKDRLDWKSAQTLLYFITRAQAATSRDNLTQILGTGWVEWKKQETYQLAYALCHPTKDDGNVDVATLRNYVYQKLPDRLKKLWDQIDFWDDDAQTGADKIERLLAGESDSVRQHLFLHALVSSSFNPSEAARKVQIPLNKVKRWAETDADFSALMTQILEHKKNFFEGALIDLVKARNPHAVIFVNKTVNADRGYSEKIDLNVSGQVDVNHHLIPIDDLDLDLDTRKKLLEAIRKRKPEQIRQEKKVEAIDA